MLDLARPGEAANEYLAGLPSTSYGVRFYLDRFAELVPAQPVHVAGHPPGPLLLMHALGIRGAGGLAALCIAGGALTAPLTYILGRTLRLGESGARLAALLCACSPVVLLFGVTSYDYLFAALGTAAATLLVARRRSLRAGGAAALAVAALFAWSLLGVGAWAAIVVARRDGIRAGAVLAAACATALAALNGALAAAYGYDPIGTLAATGGVYRDGIASIRPYAFWALGSPVAWGVMLGIPIAAAAIRGAMRGDTPAMALAAVVVAAAAGGFTKAETERIWLFLVPLACVAAAPALAGRPPARLLALLVAQALAVQALFATVW
jgi:methylthioxylose transferase